MAGPTRPHPTQTRPRAELAAPPRCPGAGAILGSAAGRRAVRRRRLAASAVVALPAVAGAGQNRPLRRAGLADLLDVPLGMC